MIDLKNRKTYLGGSDSAGVLGLSPWATPLDIYFRKVGYPGDVPTPDPERERRLRRGKIMEPVVIKMLQEEYPIKLVRVSTEEKKNYYVDDEFPFMASEIDFEWEVTEEIKAKFPQFNDLKLGSIQNGEVKTVHPFGQHEWGEADTDEIPIQYGCQAMHGIGVTQREACLVAVLFGSDNLVCYAVRRDNDVLMPMRKRLLDFWTDHVLPQIPPEPINMPDVYRTLRLRMDVDVAADAETIALNDKLIAVKSQLAVYKEHEKDLQFQICVKLCGKEAVEAKTATGRHRLMVGRTPILTVTQQSRSSIDTLLLEQNYPGAKEACTKTTSFFVVRPKGPKK